MEPAEAEEVEGTQVVGEQQSVPLSQAISQMADELEIGESDVEDALLGDVPAMYANTPRSFASLFTDDEEEVEAIVDPALLLKNCGLSEKTVRLCGGGLCASRAASLGCL